MRWVQRNTKTRNSNLRHVCVRCTSEIHAIAHSRRSGTFMRVTGTHVSGSFKYTSPLNRMSKCRQNLVKESAYLFGWLARKLAR